MFYTFPMDISSSSESEDIIDDTGCEDKWQETYWDINYIRSINNDDIGDIEEEDLPHARVIRRFAYREFDTNGEEVQESYIRDESEEEYDYSEENSEYTTFLHSDFLVIPAQKKIVATTPKISRIKVVT